MVTTLLALLSLLSFLGLTFLLYRVLITGIAKKLFKPVPSCFIYWLFVLVAPYIFVFSFAQIGNYIYTNYPSLRVAAWDVGLALNLYLSMYLSYVVGIVIAGLSSDKFFVFKKKN